MIFIIVIYRSNPGPNLSPVVLDYRPIKFVYQSSQPMKLEPAENVEQLLLKIGDTPYMKKNLIPTLPSQYYNKQAFYHKYNDGFISPWMIKQAYNLIIPIKFTFKSMNSMQCNKS